MNFVLLPSAVFAQRGYEVKRCAACSAACLTGFHAAGRLYTTPRCLNNSHCIIVKPSICKKFADVQRDSLELSQTMVCQI